jgi:2'-5' RNA ligase superfamily
MRFAVRSAIRPVLFGAVLAAALLQSTGAKAQATAAATGQNDVTAIDILLDPDATMIQHATAANAQLLKHYAKGFTLGGVHAPHITMLQRFVRTADLPKVYAAADKVIAAANPTSFRLTAFKYDYIGDAKIGNETVGVGNILVKPTPELLKLQQELADAIKPFEAPTGTAAAFVTTPQAPHISEDLIHYVSVFVPDHSGDHYVPHVSIGVGTTEFLKTFSSAPFDDFTFSPAGASVYHLGEYGTAMKKLHSVPLKK